MERFSFGFYNPNHAAALVCAVIPFCWGWMRCVWLGRVLFVLLCVMLALTQSRTGLIVLVLEMSVWWILKLRNYNSGLSKRWVRTFKRLENIFALCVMAYVFMTKYLRGSKRFKKIIKLLGENVEALAFKIHSLLSAIRELYLEAKSPIYNRSSA